MEGTLFLRFEQVRGWFEHIPKTIQLSQAWTIIMLIQLKAAKIAYTCIYYFRQSTYS